MSLNCNWLDCKPETQNRIQENTNIAFNLGLLLMCIGVNRINAKTLPTIKKRFLVESDLLKSVTNDIKVTYFDDFVGFTANVSNMTDTEYFKKVNVLLTDRIK